MSRFNTYLRGWLGLLDAKVGGVAPAQFAEFVSPGLDAWPFLHAQTRELVSGSPGAQASEGFQIISTLLVPENEVWLVEWACAYTPLNVPVGDVLVIHPAVQIRSRSLGLPREIMLSDFNLEFNTANAYRAHGTSSRPFVACPGDQFGVMYALQVGAAIDCNLALLISRCPV